MEIKYFVIQQRILNDQSSPPRCHDEPVLQHRRVPSAELSVPSLTDLDLSEVKTIRVPWQR